MKNSNKKQKNLSRVFGSIPNNSALGLILLYRAILSPSVGIFRFLPFYPKPSCVFYPTCSEFAVSCFKKYSFQAALHKTTVRISRCHAGTPPQVDLP